MRRRATVKELERDCAWWNERYPIGTQVEYHPVIGEPEFRLRRTKTLAQVLSGHTAVVWLHGERGCVAIDACTPTNPEIPSVDESLTIPHGAKCQEASVFSREDYIPCGGPAAAIVFHPKDRRSYYMCESCTHHNVRNRGGRLVSWLLQSANEQLAQPVESDEGSATNKGIEEKPE